MNDSVEAASPGDQPGRSGTEVRFGWGLIVSGVIGAACTLAALATSSSCGSTPSGTFADDPLILRTDYCELLGFPGGPDTVSSVLMVAVVFAGPPLLALAGLCAAALLGRPRVFSVSVATSIGLTIVAWGLLLLSEPEVVAI